MIIRKFTDKKPNILIFQGSPRRENSCANQTPKAQKVAEYLLDRWTPVAKLELIDLSVGKVNIQPCKGCISTANGMHCHWKCVAEDQRVHTIDGFKMIKDLKIGDILQDGNKIINHLKTSNSEEVFELKLKDGRKVEITNEHKVKILSKDRYRDIESNWKFYRKEKWVELKDLKIGDLIPTIHTDKIFSNSERNVDLDYLAYGLIWGDGTFANNTSLLYIDEKEKEFLDEIKNALNDYIISILPHKICSGTNIITDKVYDTKILKLNFGAKFGSKMKSVGFLKTNAKNRRLNLQSFQNDSNKIFSFLNGWISTDGTVHKKGITLYNTSYDCLRDLQLLLSRVGIRSNISDSRHLKCEVRGKLIDRCSSLSIIGYDSVKIVYDNIRIIHPKKQKRLEKYISILKNKMVNKPSEIKNIKSIGYKPVYDIEVENSHEFNCEGINIHNCSCYSAGSQDKPDLMYESDIYNKLEQCDGFIIITPIHWYSVSTQVKAMFDRLVCANQTITYEQAVEIFGKGNTKSSELTGAAELSGQYKHLLKNHLEGKWAGFYAHGDDGANDYDGNQPDTGDYEWDVKNCVMPLVYQCRYSGINAPDDLIESFYINRGKDYYQANLDADHTHEFFNKADILIEKMIDYILGQ